MGLGSKLKNLFRKGTQSEPFFEELEELLIEGDLGIQVALEIVESLREAIRRQDSGDGYMKTLRDLLRPMIHATRLSIEQEHLNFVLVLGVNGVGKTTSLAKLAAHLQPEIGLDRIVLSAGDTFRAGAIDQIRILGDRLGVRVVSQTQGSDPGAVIYDTISSAKAKNECLILADTAGRMHNKSHLVRELQKIDSVIKKGLREGNYHKMLVVDATTGQNCLRQAETFHEALGVDSLFLAKYDSSSKGGMVVTVCKELGIPVSYLGVGEKPQDIIPFDVDSYLQDLLEA